MNVLIACEESQRVCIEMRRIGHNAFSCDIQPCSGGHPEWHIQGDCLPLIDGDCQFMDMTGGTHQINGEWDLLIAHPPCTYLSAAGAIWLYDKDHNIKSNDRMTKILEAAQFFKQFIKAQCGRIAVENPVPLKIADLPPYSQIIEPFQFGDPWRKRTCLWLMGLPLLSPTDLVEPHGYWVGAHEHERANKGMSKGFRNQKMRSKTFPGIARAMAEQWAGKCKAGIG